MDELRPYQVEGADWLAANDRALLADEMGLGKTPQAAVAMNHRLGSYESALVVCPASLKINWKRELAKWSPRLVSHIVSGTTSRFPTPFDADGRPSVVIINYDILKAYHDQIRKTKWGITVCDESHYLKTLDSQRTKEVRGGFGLSPIPTRIKWALTGTPIPNRTMEIYSTAKWLELSFAKTEAEFGLRYCNGHVNADGWDFSGRSNSEELKFKLKPYMLRRLKRDVLPDLPEKIRQIVEIEPDAAGRSAIKQEKKYYPGLPYDEIAAGLCPSSLGEADFAILSKLRKATALTKLGPCAEHIGDYVDAAGKVIVFGWHTDAIEGIRARLAKRFGEEAILVITGSTSEAQRQKNVDLFQSDPRIMAIVGNIQAMGMGWTLTAASLVFFIEESWVPGEISQCEDRAHRFTQKFSVLAQHLVLADSIDAHMVKSQVRKQNDIDAILL